MRSDTVYHLLKRIAKEEFVDIEIKEDETIKLHLESYKLQKAISQELSDKKKRNWVEKKENKTYQKD